MLFVLVRNKTSSGRHATSPEDKSVPVGKTALPHGKSSVFMSCVIPWLYFCYCLEHSQISLALVCWLL